MTDSPPVITRRRNGTVASCEPCRKRKTRCDHRRPVCSRCRQRNEQLTCVYHPAPLTKKSGLNRPDSLVASDGLAEPVVLPDPISHALPPASIAATSPFSITTNHHPERAVDGFVAEASPDPIVQAPAQRFGRPCSKTITREQVASVAQVLGRLRDSGFLQHLVTTYYSASQASVIPSSLISSALPSLTETINAFNLFNGTADDNAELLRLSEAVLCSTATQINIDASLTPSGFMGLYTGATLRLEYLGIVFSVAARSCLIGLARDTRQRDDFIQDMFSCSTTCLKLARKITPVNDMLVWFGQDHFMLTACVEGDSNEDTWRCLGDLHSDIIALGIYRESFNVNNTPFFLVECRRKVFAKVYYIDKFISTLFDRPPRLLKRHSDSKWPLDLADAEVLAGPAELAQAQAKLTPDGWNAEGKFCASTWARVRCITAEMLEEIYEYNFCPMTADNVAKLKNISLRNCEAWEAIPSHLHYNARCWTSELHPQVCFMLTVIRLAFLQCDFQIFRILERSDPLSTQQFLKVSFEMISLIQELGSFRRKAIYLHLRFSYIILCYGLSPAMVLAKATQNLAKSTSHNSSLPPELNRSRLIQTLSVFISQLESISGPGEPNYYICVQASKAISRTLDELLNPSPDHLALANTTPSAPQFSDLDNMNLGIVGADPVSGHIWDEFDLPSFASNFDWTAIHGEWSLS